MGSNSIRQTVETMSAWRSGLKHIKERKAKLDERNRRKQRRSISVIQNLLGMGMRFMF
jgi:hypothetical protein